MRKALLLSLSLALTVLVAAQPSSKVKEWEVQADTLMQREDFAGAIRLYTRCIETTRLQEAANYNALYKRAVCYYQSGEHQNALKDLESFIPKFPEARQPHILRALVYRELHQDADVLKELEELAALGASDAPLMKWKASLLIEANRFEEARRDLLLVKAVQDDPETETYLAFSYFNLQQPDSALVCVNKSIELDVTYQPAYLYAGSFLIQAKRYAEAITYLNLALRLEPKNPTALFYKGVALVEENHIDAGCSCLNKSFYLGNDDAQGYLKEYCYSVED